MQPPSHRAAVAVLDRLSLVVLRWLEAQVMHFKRFLQADMRSAPRNSNYWHKFIQTLVLPRSLYILALALMMALVAIEWIFDIRFLYDIELPDAEKWVLETSRQLQQKYRATKTPKFKVLIQQDGMFTTEDVEIANFDAIDIQELYNDDFVEMDTIITASMQKRESGMVLLHGEPGTGKTTYIKHLICKYQNKQFIFIQNDFVKDLLKPSFISFLLQNKNAILIISYNFRDASNFSSNDWFSKAHCINNCISKRFI